MSSNSYRYTTLGFDEHGRAQLRALRESLQRETGPLSQAQVIRLAIAHLAAVRGIVIPNTAKDSR